MATSKAATKAAPAEAAPAKSNRTLILIAVAVVVLAIAGAVSAWLFLGAAQPANGAEKAAPPKPPVFMTLESFTVNLQNSDEGHQQFLQVGITLQVADEKQTDLLKLHMPQVRSRLLLLLSSKKASEILNTDGKNQLSSDIQTQLKLPFTDNGPIPDVSGVFFTSFVVQ